VPILNSQCPGLHSASVFEIWESDYFYYFFLSVCLFVLERLFRYLGILIMIFFFFGSYLQCDSSLSLKKAKPTTSLKLMIVPGCSGGKSFRKKKRDKCSSFANFNFHAQKKKCPMEFINVNQNFSEL
jgi:hypothetical protein